MGCSASTPNTTTNQETSPAVKAEENATGTEGSEEKKEEAAAPAPAAGDVPGQVAQLVVSNPDCICFGAFDASYYNGLNDDQKKGLELCMKSGLENPDSGVGVYAMNPGDYDDYKPYFSKVLAMYHKVAEDAVHTSNWDLASADLGDLRSQLPEDVAKLDVQALGISEELSMRVRVGRNASAFPLPGAMTKDDRVNLEKLMCEKVFGELIKDENFGGGYNSLTPDHENFINEEQYNELVKAHIMFKDMAADKYLASAGIASDWPYGRGCYVSADKQFIIWLGEEDHLRIMCMKKGFILNEVFDRLKTALDVVEKFGVPFAKSETYGNVTSCPTNLGTGMRASVHIKVPNLTNDGTDTKAKAIAKGFGLSVRGTGGEHTPIGSDGTIDLSPSARYCISEAKILASLYVGIRNLKAEEDKGVSE